MQELKNKDAAVVVFSGGQDSTTCLFWALKRYKKVIALSFDYHQKHVKELECAKKICRDHEVEHHIMDMSLLNQLAPNSLTRVDIKVDESAPEEGTPNSFVDGVICMDADLQHPVECIPQILDAFHQGYEVVSMVRMSNKSAGLFKNITSKLFYKILNGISETHFEENASDFFAVTKRPAEVLRKHFILTRKI